MRVLQKRDPEVRPFALRFLRNAGEPVEDHHAFSAVNVVSKRRIV